MKFYQSDNDKLSTKLSNANNEIKCLKEKLTEVAQFSKLSLDDDHTSESSLPSNSRRKRSNASTKVTPSSSESEGQKQRLSKSSIPEESNVDGDSTEAIADGSKDALASNASLGGSIQDSSVTQNNSSSLIDSEPVAKADKDVQVTPDLLGCDVKEEKQTKQNVLEDDFSSHTKEEFQSAVNTGFEQVADTINAFIKLAGKLTKARAQKAKIPDSKKTSLNNPRARERNIAFNPPKTHLKDLVSNHKMFGVNRNNRKSVQVPGFFPQPFKHESSEETMHRNWTESGFFDEEELQPSTSIRSSKWNPKILKKSSSHVLRFLYRISRNKCSHVERCIGDVMKNEGLFDDDIIAKQMEIFAEHAVDLLDIISFSIQRMSQTGVDFKDEDKDAMMLEFNGTWDPDKSLVDDVENETKRVKFLEEIRAIQDKEHELNAPPSTPMFPEIAQRPNANSKKRDLHSVSTMQASDKSKMVRAAECRKKKLLERHRKLVERLKRSGVGMKQIYTILGLNKRTEDDADEDEIATGLENAPPSDAAAMARMRKISMKGHAFQYGGSNSNMNLLQKDQDKHYDMDEAADQPKPVLPSPVVNMQFGFNTKSITQNVVRGSAAKKKAIPKSLDLKSQITSIPITPFNRSARKSIAFPALRSVPPLAMRNGLKVRNQYHGRRKSMITYDDFKSKS